MMFTDKIICEIVAPPTELKFDPKHQLNVMNQDFFCIAYMASLAK